MKQDKKSFLFKLLPHSVAKRVEQRPALNKIFNNMSWLLTDRVIRMGVGLVIGVWLARYFGPENFGLLSFSMAIVGLFSILSSLGLNGVVVKDLVNEPENSNEILGTSFTLQFIGGFLALILSIIFIYILRPEDELAKIFVSILGTALIFRSSFSVKYWFESQVESKYVVLAENIIFITISIVKISMILMQAPIIAFVWVTLIEAILSAIALLYVYNRYGDKIKNWRISISRSISLLKESWPLFLSGMALMVYMRVDQIMIGRMLDDHSLGLYAAAIKLNEAWSFIPTIICASVFPAIIKLRNVNKDQYHERIQQVFDLLVAISLSIALFVTFFSDEIMIILFGEVYSDAAFVLMIHIWTSVFVFLGIASGRWLISEGLSHLALMRTLFGLIINLILNYLLIPKYGINGAAVASLISYMIANYISYLFNPKLYKLFSMTTKALLLVRVFKGRYF